MHTHVAVFSRYSHILAGLYYINMTANYIIISYILPSIKC